MKNNSDKITIIKPVFQIIVLIIVLTVATVSWFIFERAANLSPLNANVSRAMNVQISPDGLSWRPDLTISSEAAVSITELSGNGKNLYVPIVKNKAISGFLPISQQNAKNNFIEFQTFIKTDTSINLFLDKESSITPLDLSTNKSTYGEYSKNYIAGATRVAFLTEDEITKELTPIYTWAPNSTMEYQSNENAVLKNGAVESIYSYATGNNASDLNIIQTNNKAYGVSNDRSFIWGNIDWFSNLEDIPPLFTIYTDNKKDVVKKLVIRVWIEGTDREAVLPLLGGKFKMNFKFNPAEIA